MTSLGRSITAFQLSTEGTGQAIPLTQLCPCLPDQHLASSSATWGTDRHGSTTQPPGSFGTAQPMDEASRSLPTTRRPSPCRQTAASGLAQEPRTLPTKHCKEQTGLYSVLSDCPVPAAWAALALAAGRPVQLSRDNPHPRVQEHALTADTLDTTSSPSPQHIAISTGFQPRGRDRG